ncbi:MAG: hypothetical protein ABFC63_10385 [Thermoguttaceae bacterium]
MRSKMMIGALLVSAALCSQGFGFELLDRMLGLNCGGCGGCNTCKVACCEKANPAKCCPQPCAKTACEKPCIEGCQKVKKCRPTPVRDLFGNMVDLFEAKAYVCDPCTTKACGSEQGCFAKAAACEKACGACEKCCKVKRCRRVACEKPCGACCPATCAKPCAPACVTSCEKVRQPKCHKLYRRPVVELLEKLFGERRCVASCGNVCETACGGCEGTTAPAKKAAPTTAPAKAPEAAPLPAAPKADPSAAVPSRGIYQASRSLVRN